VGSVARRGSELSSEVEEGSSGGGTGWRRDLAIGGGSVRW
jgi:hypothetical protein